MSLPPIARGYARTYERCNGCQTVYFRDYVPYGMSAGILTMPCGCNMGARHEQRVTTLDAAEALPLIAAQMRERFGK